MLEEPKDKNGQGDEHYPKLSFLNIFKTLTHPGHCLS
jgi:hypothetical protein